MTKNIDPAASEVVVNAILNFMDQHGMADFKHHRGYISRVVTEDDLIAVKSEFAGFFDCKVHAGDYVRSGQLIAEIIDTGDAAVKAEITAPEEGTVFFVQSNPLAFAGGQLMLILR